MRGTVGALSVAASVLAFALSGPAPGSAQERAPEPPRRDAVDWLAHEPVTLLDWGMMKLRRDLDQSVDHLTRSYTRRPPLRTGVFFRFQDRRIIAYVTLVDVPANRTADACRDVFVRVAGVMVGDALQGPGGASWYLENVFGHDAYRGERPSNLGDQLADQVNLQVVIGPTPENAYDDGRRVTCSGRLDARHENIALRAEG